MKKTLLYIFGLMILSGFLFTTSCKKTEIYSNIPQITFESYELWADTFNVAYQGNLKMGVLAFRLIDGDGDVGETSNEVKNLFITLQEKVSGKFKNVVLKDTLDNTTPYIPPGGLDKSLKAKVLIEFIYYPGFDNYDTIRYIFYLKDHAGNVSNIDTTPAIPFKSKYLKITK